MNTKEVVTFTAVLFTQVAIAAPPQFHQVSDMIVPASQHRDILLPNGSVLLTGGQSGEGGIADAQLYNPETKTFQSAGMMTEPRFVHAMNLLNDGRVLITAGFSKAGQFLQTSEFFDGKKFVKGPDLVENRDNQRTVNLPDGRVFIEGGDSEKYGYIASTELFDQGTNSFTAGPTLPNGRAMDTISQLNDGRVIMAGGMKIVDSKQVYLNETVIFDAKANTVSTGPDLKVARKQHRATELADGRILFTGGMNETGTLMSAEIYAKGKISSIGNMSLSRREHCTVPLSDGTVFIAGGHTGNEYTSTTEIFDPRTNEFSVGPEMGTARAFHTCTPLENGDVLVAGGYNSGGAIRSAEVLNR